jgi:protease IV
MTLTGIILALVLAGGDEGFGLGSRVAVLEVDGVIVDDEAMLEQIRRFRRDGSVKAFVVDINSPGGAVGPSQSIYRELRKLREEDDRPVLAAIGAVGASGGYYIALAADSIYALPGSITGSIGVIMEFPNAAELMDRVGVRVEVVKSAEHKDIGSPFRPITEEDRAVLGSLVQDVYGQFVDVVATERSLPDDRVRELADGRILSGRQALESGLIDGIGNLQDVLARAGEMAGLGDDPAVVRPPEPRFTIFDVLTGRAVTEVLNQWLGPLQPGAAPRLQYLIPW